MWPVPPYKGLRVANTTIVALVTSEIDPRWDEYPEEYNKESMGKQRWEHLAETQMTGPITQRVSVP